MPVAHCSYSGNKNRSHSFPNAPLGKGNSLAENYELRRFPQCHQHSTSPSLKRLIAGLLAVYERWHPRGFWELRWGWPSHASLPRIVPVSEAKPWVPGKPVVSIALTLPWGVLSSWRGWDIRETLVPPVFRNWGHKKGDRGMDRQRHTQGSCFFSHPDTPQSPP